MPDETLIFRVHAIERMAQRSITAGDIRRALAAGEVIEDYPADLPYPSSLVLGWIGSRPLHVVSAVAPEGRIIITVYEPDPARWQPDFKTRKP
jgi:hypothetical protein